MMIRNAIFTLFLLVGATLGFALERSAHADNGCPEGSYSVVFTPDGLAMSVIFDRFVLEAGSSSTALPITKTCSLEIPLNLPPQMSLGVYRVDYRGFTFLQKKQTADLKVAYTVGKKLNKTREFKRKIKGPISSDYLFSEDLPPGLLKRMGCGEKAVINLDIALTLDPSNQGGQAIASLDSADSAASGAFIYRFDLTACPKKNRN